ncbi:hypothetical protein DFJ77DRAFT_471441 [Powellomyces hirtus]|nr:hypothetical protein DFJ77DRAFT_471441 [Powellomyces hirtus]
MAGKKKGKAKEKGKKRRSSPSRGKKGKKMDASQASAVLTFIMVESRKQSVLLYRTEFLEQKAELKRLRERLRRVQHDRYGYLRNVIDTTDAMTGKLETLQTQSPGFGLVMDLASDEKLVQQQELIEELHDMHHALAHNLATLTATHATLQSSSAMASLSEQAATLRAEMVEQAARHEAEIALLQKRHQAAIDGSVKRGEKIVMGVEGSASQHEMDTMPDSSLAVLQRNIRLKSKTKAALAETQRLEQSNHELHAMNLALVCEAGDVDWDLGLGLLPSSPPSDVETENGDALDEKLTKSALVLPLLPTNANRTSLTLTSEKILYTERVRRDTETRRSGLGVLGTGVELKRVDVKHNGGLLLYSSLIEPT